MIKRKDGVQLNSNEHWLLCEALRRFSRFGHDYGNKITMAWTGLGSASQYRAALDAGFMTYATSPNPGFMTWWKLTRKGARIVRAWLNAGHNAETIEHGEMPSPWIPKSKRILL